MKPKLFIIGGCVVVLGLCGLAGFAGDKKDKTADSSSSTSTKETVAKPLTEKERRKKEKQLQKELETPYKKWLSEDVGYIITDEERQAFKRLQTDEERQNFIEGFWLRRDPTPDTEENEFKEEHYRRIAYANEHYASGIPGWKTDRGRIYIVYGPPDEIESHPSGGTYERPIEEGGGTTSTYPFEDWRYRYIDGIGNNVMIEFVDPTMSGEYHMTMDPSEKDALLYVPGAGLTMYEQMGMSSKTDRFSRTDGTHLGTGGMPLPASMNEFERLEQFAKLQKPPQVKFKDLESAVTSTIRFNTLPMKVHADFIKITDSTVLTPITVQFDWKDLNFSTKDGIAKSTVNIYGRITSIAGRVVTYFEDVAEVAEPAELLDKATNRSSIYQKTVPLAPGMYRLNVVAKDIVSSAMTSYQVALNVPHFDDEKLSSSTLILADVIEKVATRSIGTGQFVIGDSKVRPRLNDTFARDEKLGIYAQFYNFSADEKTHKPQGTIEYEITKNGTNQKVLDYTEDVTSLPGASSQQVTVEKLLPLQSLEPGQYTLTMKVTDKARNQVLTPTTGFTVK
ncbi:MAG TPA: GWxTD domain-containing protein [Bryobacteraceae bacterium]|nr:GWxTD domain-containing protein [Bryobacteraceae bacterium]